MSESISSKSRKRAFVHDCEVPDNSSSQNSTTSLPSRAPAPRRIIQPRAPTYFASINEDGTFQSSQNRVGGPRLIPAWVAPHPVPASSSWGTRWETLRWSVVVATRQRNVQWKTVDFVYFPQREIEHLAQNQQRDEMDDDGRDGLEDLPNVTILVYAVTTANSGTSEWLGAAK